MQLPGHSVSALKQTLGCGTFALTWVPGSESLYVHGDKADKNVTVSGTELFSFGAGEFVKQAQASDVMGDHEGRWIAFGLNANSFVILEGQKTRPDNLKTLSVLGQASWRFQIFNNLKKASSSCIY